MRPRYMIDHAVDRCSTTPRSWLINRYVRLNSVAQSHEQIQHLRLDRDVECGDRLVANQQLRLDGQRSRDTDACALSAGKLMRKAPSERGSSPTCRISWSTYYSMFLASGEAMHTRRFADDFDRRACADSATRTHPGRPSGSSERHRAARHRSRSAISVPRHARVPLVGVRMPAAMRPSVDLPQPDSPASPTTSPSA